MTAAAVMVHPTLFMVGGGTQGILLLTRQSTVEAGPGPVRTGVIQTIRFRLFAAMVIFRARVPHAALLTRPA